MNEVKNFNTYTEANKEHIAELQQGFQRLRDRVEKMDGPSRGEFDTLKQRVDALENKIANIMKIMDGINKKLKGVQSGSAAGGADQELVDRLSEDLERLREEFEAYRDQSQRNLGDLNQQMPTKADKQDLIDLENRIMDQLREMIQQILSQMPNKDDIMKRFAQISKKIKEIMEALGRVGTRPEDDDGMFTKKPYGPVACAACEKNLVNIQGLQVDYHVWKKLPFREPGERLARYGQGFSKILQNMKGSVDASATIEDASLHGYHG